MSKMDTQKKTTWNNSLTHIDWRVDVKTASKNNAELNEPVALFQISISAGHVTDGGHSTGAVSERGSTGSNKPIKFEMDRQQVDAMLATLETIKHKIDEASY